MYLSTKTMEIACPYLINNQQIMLMSQLSHKQSQWLDMLLPDSAYILVDPGTGELEKACDYATYEYWMGYISLSYQNACIKSCLEV